MGKGKKKPGRAQTVGEIFASVSTISAAGLNPPPQRVVLTPRSAEACLKFGINPESLRIRDLDSFREPGIDPAVQRMRHEAYSQRRHEHIYLENDDSLFPWVLGSHCDLCVLCFT